LEQFGEKLEKTQTAKGLSLRALADTAEMDFGNISEIENGKINPSLTTIVLLAQALEVSPGELISSNR
jgi:transcriptional regulator with XRE-family HTH domain